jgi:CHASE2 domain-containing sensor protein
VTIGADASNLSQQLAEKAELTWIISWSVVLQHITRRTAKENPIAFYFSLHRSAACPGGGIIRQCDFSSVYMPTGVMNDNLSQQLAEKAELTWIISWSVVLQHITRRTAKEVLFFFASERGLPWWGNHKTM